MSFFLACVSFWAITTSDSSVPAAEGHYRLIGGYELHELQGPFSLREEADAATCADVERVRVGGGVLHEAAERVVVQAADEEDVRQQLLQLSLRRYDQP